MQVIIGCQAGFCDGVKRALNLAYQTAEKYGKVYTLGELINNNRVVEELKSKNVIPIYSTDNVRDSVVIIRSHGVSRNIYSALKANNNTIVDATCPYVQKIHNLVNEYSDKGYHIIILGKRTHPEVQGIIGWCDNSSIIENLDECALPQNAKKFFVVAQTTFSNAKYIQIKEKLQSLASNSAKTVEFFNSICYTTLCRQLGAERVAKSCDAVFVLGDASSSNTNKLFLIAKQYCDNVCLISDVTDLNSVTYISNITKLGILAGASTPKELIMEVINRMDQENTVDTIAVDDVKPTETTEEVVVVASEAQEQKQEAVVVPVAKKAKSEEPMTMDEAMKKYNVRAYREGMKLKARIISVDITGVSVAVDGNMGKNDSGFIDKEEMELDSSFNPENYKPDDMLDVIIIPKKDNKSKAINLSKKAYDAIKIEDEAVKKILEGEEFTLVCSQSIKGGLLGKLGTYTIFVPASQLRMGYVKNLDDYVGKKLRLRILPPKDEEVVEGEEPQKQHRPNPKRIVASQRIILEEEKEAREDAFWEVMQVNNIIKGKVKRFTPFGAFVSIMNFDCLAHISDLSWTKIADPSEVLELGKSYDFVVIKVDRESGKVSLGYKQLQKKPYELAAEKYHVGDIIKGKVERIKDFGAFIEIEPGIDGLVHVSEIGYKWIANANEALKIGDEIEAKIIGFENNKITLSIKALIDPPVVEEAPAETASDSNNGDNAGDATSSAPAEKPNRSARFNKRAEAATSDNKDRHERRPRRDKEESDEPREWVSSAATGATFADLFKGLDINQFEDGEDDNK